MSAIPDGYNPYGLQPNVIISDSEGVEKYRFESYGNVKDFTLVKWDILGSINTEHGSANLAIRDDAGLLLDTSKRRTPKIVAGDLLTIDLGKDEQYMQRWFGGVVAESAVQRPGYGLQDILIKAFGWGIYTAHRTAVLAHSQRLTAEGLSYDPTDANSKVDAIFKRLLTDASLLTLSNQPLPTFNVDAVAASDILVPEMHYRYHTVAAILSELANYADCVYGIDPDKNVFMHLRGSLDSGFLITNDTDVPSRRTRSWDRDKLMLMQPGSPSFKDSGIGAAYSHLVGVGAQRLLQGYESTQSNATRLLRDTWIGIPITTLGSTLRKVTPYMARVGVLTEPLRAHIVGNEAGPNMADIRQSTIVSADRLNRELNSAGWFGLLFDKIDVAADEVVYLVIEKYPDAVNYPYIDYQTGAGGFSTSADGVIWGGNVGSMKLRAFGAQTIHIIGQNVTAAKRFNYTKESIIPMYDLPDEETALAGMEGLLNTLSHDRRICDPVICSAPSTRPPLGQTLRVYDSHNGADFSAELIGYTIGGDADTVENLGATKITLYLEEYK